MGGEELDDVRLVAVLEEVHLRQVVVLLSGADVIHLLDRHPSFALLELGQVDATKSAFAYHVTDLVLHAGVAGSQQGFYAG